MPSTVNNHDTNVLGLVLPFAVSLRKRHLRLVEVRNASLSIFGPPVRCSPQLLRAIVESCAEDFMAVV